MAKTVKVDKKDLKQIQKSADKLAKQTDKAAAARVKEKEYARNHPKNLVGLAQYVNKQRDKASGLPLLLKAGVVLMAVRWYLDRREQARADRDLQDAIRFLRENRGFEP
jgi:hypothetical protein